MGVYRIVEAHYGLPTTSDWRVFSRALAVNAAASFMQIIMGHIYDMETRPEFLPLATSRREGTN